MKKHEIIFSLLKIPLDFSIVIGSFFVAKSLREVQDLIPHFPMQVIEKEFLLPFALFGGFLYIIIFSIHGLYSLKSTSSKVKEFFDIILYSIYFFLFFSIFIYFGKGVFYEVEIPRLIIIFATFFTIIGVIIERVFLHKIYEKLLEKSLIPKRNIVLINSESDEKIASIIQDIQDAKIYNILGYINKKKQSKTIDYLGESKDFLNIIETYPIDEILYIESNFSPQELYEIWDISRIYGIRYRYITNSFDITKTNTQISLLNKIPVMEIKNTALDAGGRVAKRIFDIFGALIGIIIFFPLFLIIGFFIKKEDPLGPIIYKNTRIGQHGKKFYLYKFRYLKWEYCIKESYGIENKKDSALEYEKELIKKQSKRKGPLYKIENDPRKTKIGTFIEKYSLDELPQLFNVLLGNMSLVGPRPHQPREVEKYILHQKRVLNIKPGITGLAQVNGRENNSFEQEVSLDIFYMENWNFLLDMKIFLKTFSVIFNRK